MIMDWFDYVLLAVGTGTILCGFWMLLEIHNEKCPFTDFSDPNWVDKIKE